MMLLFRWLSEILDALPVCSGSSSTSTDEYYSNSQKEEEFKMTEVDADDRTWCSTQWVGGMKQTLNDDVTLATRDDYTVATLATKDDYMVATKEDFTVATCPTDSMSEKS
ncbi:unnamed protein product [Cylindrotheca closterium]|uniref:Uncharacterized protein n=1 Tax=Cylindrotheca closterium TaxID=2856 RepID=A0AAD2CCV7_9STRA|nr:unnamed protein product [Cylindrotheca closterium]